MRIDTVHVNTSSAANKILAFKDLLRARFPAAHAHLPSKRAEDRTSTGIPCLDAVELVRGAATEIVSESGSAGTGLLIAGLLQRDTAVREPVALVDARDAFDPRSVPPEALERLFWVRCREVAGAMRVADLLLRDGNLPLVMLDLQAHEPRELQRVPASSWHRLRMLAEKSGVALCVFSPCSTVPCARARLLLQQRFTLDAMERPRRELLDLLQAKVARGGVALEAPDLEPLTALAG